MKNSIFFILAMTSISLLSCKKEAVLKPAAQQPVPKAALAVKTVPAVKTQLYDYEKAVLIKRTIRTY